MNDDSKLPQSITGAVISWVAVGWAWVNAHAATLGVVAAVVASVYSIWASRETIKLRKKQQDAFDAGYDDREEGFD